MNAFDTAAVLLAVAALSGYFNHRILRLPATTGTLAVALVSSLLLVAVDQVVPAWGLRDAIAAFLGEIDFNEALMHGMLGFLLFAGALHVNLDDLLDQKWTIGALATIGPADLARRPGRRHDVWWLFRLFGFDIPFMVCLVFGRSDLPDRSHRRHGLAQGLNAPRSLEAQDRRRVALQRRRGRGAVLRAGFSGGPPGRGRGAGDHGERGGPRRVLPARGRSAAPRSAWAWAGSATTH